MSFEQPRPHIARPSFVDRETERHQLEAAFDRAMAGEGSLAMVVGEPGIGKTSLCEQLAGYVKEKDGTTLVGRTLLRRRVAIAALPSLCGGDQIVRPGPRDGGPRG